jgi:hypothetical protein
VSIGGVFFWINRGIFFGGGIGWICVVLQAFFEGGGGIKGVFWMVNCGDFVVDCW